MPAIDSARLFAHVDAHNAAEQVHDNSIHKTDLTHFLLHSALAGIMARGSQNVGVRRSIAEKEPAKTRHEPAEIGEVEGAPESVVGFAEVEHQRPPAGPEHAPHLAKAAFKVRQIPKSVTDRPHTKTGIRHGQRLRIPTDKFTAGRRQRGQATYPPLRHG